MCSGNSSSSNDQIMNKKQQGAVASSTMADDDKKQLDNNGVGPPADEPIPTLICQFWRTVAANVSRHFPIRNTRIFGLDVSLTVVSAILLTCVRYTAEYTMVYFFGWPINHISTKLAAASVGSIFHSIQLVPALAVLFYQNGWNGYNPSQKMVDEKRYWHETTTALLQFCTGYMLYDGLLNILFLKLSMSKLDSDDYMFLGHHLATTLYMTSTRILGAGHQSAMMCMFLGELTNPLHNAHYVADFAQPFDCCNGEFSQSLHFLIRMAFSCLYVVIRAVVAPVVMLHVTYNLWTTGRRNIPIGWLILWTLLIWGVMIGSIPWIGWCWNFVQQHGIAKFLSSSSSETAEL